MNYLNVREIADKWGVNVSLVRQYCADGRISNAVLRNGVWCIPEDAVRTLRTQKAAIPRSLAFILSSFYAILPFFN